MKNHLFIANGKTLNNPTLVIENLDYVSKLEFSLTEDKTVKICMFDHKNNITYSELDKKALIRLNKFINSILTPKVAFGPKK